MQFPPSFLGARADALMDIVILSLALIVPIILISWSKVKKGNYRTHRTIQLTLGIVLAVVVYLFEMDLRSHGGIFVMVEGSSYAGTTFLNGSIWFHTALSILTSLIWLFLIIISLIRFGKNPAPNAFSNTHRLWGRLGMWGMILTGVTGVQLYIFGFFL